MNKLREKLSAKLSKNGGFTLMEMLIVVAIIAILIAVSIPMFNAALERAREATDAANERAAKAEILTCYMLGLTSAGEEPSGSNTAIVADTEYTYDAGSGKLNGNGADLKYGKCSNHKGQYVLVKIDASNNVSIRWSGDAADGWNNADLCSTKVANK